MMSTSNNEIWNINYMNRKVMDLFYMIQDAWMKREIWALKCSISDKLNQSLSSKIDMMFIRNEVNKIEKISIRQISLGSFIARPDKNYESFTAYISYSMISYYIDLESGFKKSGSQYRPKSYREYWTFIAQNNDWILDEIYEMFGIGGKKMREYSTV